MALTDILAIGDILAFTRTGPVNARTGPVNAGVSIALVHSTCPACSCSDSTLAVCAAA